MKTLSEHLFSNRQTVRYRPLLVVAVCVGTGIALDRMVLPVAWPYGFACWSFLAALTLSLALLCGRMKAQNLGVRKSALGGDDSRGLGWQRQASWWLLAALVSTGGLWQHVRWNYFSSDDLSLFAHETAGPVCIEAVALARPILRPAPPANPLRAMEMGPRSETMLRVQQIRDGPTWRSVSGYCKLRVAGVLSQIHAGDRLLLFGQLGKLPQMKNPGQYDWQSKERSEGRTCQLFCATSDCVTVIQASNGWSLSYWIDPLRTWCQQVLSRYVGPELGGLAGAILLGAREGLDPRASTSYLQTGTVHLLVVSGLHVGILASLLWSIVRLGLLPRHRVLLLTAAVIVTYAVLVGSRPPVVRATVIVVMWLLAMALGRKPSGANILAAAALVVLAWNPSELFRGGTQLSFVSVAVLAAYARWMSARGPLDPLDRLLLAALPWYRRAIRWILRSFWHVIVASALIWLITMPLVAYHFHILAPIGVLISPLVWPLFTVALVAGLGTIVCGWLPPVASLLGQVCAVCLQGLQATVQWAQGMEFGHAYVPGPPWWWLLISYAGLAWLALQWGWQPDSGQAAAGLNVGSHRGLRIGPVVRQIALVVCWLASGAWLATARAANHDSMVCTFLAMGHGTCVVLELPGGQTVLYDVGSIGSPEGASRCVAAYLWSRGITHIDAIVLSHADIDHYNGIPGLLERFSVDGIYVSPHMFDKPSGVLLGSDSRQPVVTKFVETRTAPEYLRLMIESRGVPLRVVALSDQLPATDSHTRMEVLHPDRQRVAGRDNANSILLSVEYEGWRILLPGDLESPGLEAVMAGSPYDCDVLLAPHHGSVHSNPAGFATWCNPEWVVVSGKYPGIETSMADSYRQQGAEVVYTSTQGAIRFTLTRDGMSVFCFRTAFQEYFRRPER